MEHVTQAMVGMESVVALLADMTHQALLLGLPLELVDNVGDGSAHISNERLIRRRLGRNQYYVFLRSPYVGRTN